MPAIVAVTVTVSVAGVFLLSCSSDESLKPPPIWESHAERPPNPPFTNIGDQARALVAAAVIWHAPQSMDVKSTQRIGLEIGDSHTLGAKI
ncbi:hypothetical protein ACFVAV_30755 [Nocardia sp. NPDC057663]|uniref:hypothetical protein n=1 Tax=Nocardia sp. NPDC057663 TaxID=3346201 RepID=UPI00367053CD